MKIRKAEPKDLSRIAEIFVFNNRINYFPIFHEEAYSFGEMQVVPMIDQYFKKEEILNRIYVYDDGIIRGFTEINGTEICKLYVDPCQSVIFCGQFNTCLSVSLPAPALRFRSSNLSYLFPALWAIL